jgi:hypothetical protein
VERLAGGRVDAFKVRELGMTSASEQYRQYAAECLRIAKETNDPAQKIRLLEMAEAWKRLAESSSKRNGD